MTLKILLKQMFSNVLSFSGTHFLLERSCFARKAFVLMYHRVICSADNLPCYVQPGMFVTTAVFEKQISFMKNKFQVIFLDDLVAKLLNNEDVSGYCAITFDDGWRDNFTDAYPVLEKYQVPATIFLATAFVDADKLLWSEEICYYLDQYTFTRPKPADEPESFVRFVEEIYKNSKHGREIFLDRSIETLKRVCPDDREEVLEYFRNRFKRERIPWQMLNWDEARKMFASGLVRFGAHTVNHEILDQLPLHSVRYEVSNSRDVIEQQIGCKVSAFAYPNGNHNESIKTLLAESGFNAAVTTHKGFVDRQTSLMEIPRIGMHEDISNTIPMFRSRILLRNF